MASPSVIAKQANIKHEELKLLLSQIAEQYQFTDELERLKTVRRVPKHPELTRLWETEAIIAILKKFLPADDVVTDEQEEEVQVQEENEVVASEPEVPTNESDVEADVIEPESVDEKPKRKRG